MKTSSFSTRCGRSAARPRCASGWPPIGVGSTSSHPGCRWSGLVGGPADYPTLSGDQAEDKQMDLRVRLLFMNRLHESIVGSGSICLAAASRIPGTVVAEVAENRSPGELLSGHPSGITPTKVRARATADGITFDVLGFSRTARRLMDGTAYYPHPEKEVR